jgi:chromosome partitioning protein
MDFQDAIAAGLGVSEFSGTGSAAREIETLWRWARAQLTEDTSTRGDDIHSRQAAA